MVHVSMSTRLIHTCEFPPCFAHTSPVIACSRAAVANASLPARPASPATLQESCLASSQALYSACWGGAAPATSPWSATDTDARAGLGRRDSVNVP